MAGLAPLLVFFALCASTHGGKLVMLPAAELSHVSQAVHIATALVNKGHDVYMVFPDNYKQLDKYKSGPMKILTHHTPGRDSRTYDMDKIIIDMIGAPLKKVLSQEPPGGRQNCHNILSDQNLYKRLNELKPDFFLVDSFMFTHCVYTIPYRLGVPYMSYGTVQLPEWARSPALPSFVPLKFGTPYTEKMTFFERLDNTFQALEWSWDPKPAYNGVNWVEQYAPEKPPVPLHELVKQSSLWLVNNDILVDYPRPLMPNEIFVGGLTTKPAKPLPNDLEKIASSAKHGVIVMSFGSGLPDLHSETFVKVFSKLKQVVFWRHMSEYKGNTPVPKNVHMLKWLPQADLLAHNNTKLFITHGGANGQFEALYHGMPMLAFPAFAEQPYNAMRMAYHGFGRVMNILAFTEKELEEAITDIITDPSYMKKINHASKIYRSRPQSPTERTTYWVDHVLKYGDSHLKSHALQMPWYTYCMLDIFAFLTGIVTVFAIVMYKLFKRCCSKKRPKPKSE